MSVELRSRARASLPLAATTRVLPEQSEVSEPLLVGESGDYTPHPTRSESPFKITCWKLLQTSVVLGLGAPKAWLSYAGEDIGPTTLDLVVGVIFVILQIWISPLENAEPPVMPWFFKDDLSIHLERSVDHDWDMIYASSVLSPGRLDAYLRPVNFVGFKILELGLVMFIISMILFILMVFITILREQMFVIWLLELGCWSMILGMVIAILVGVFKFAADRWSGPRRRPTLQT
ncbi:hypothetical protein CALVIDRAFT_96317 [Calocera viscosa TUFC12733]|uniref:Uncharacterized protein n=1 Tax=Calocera viscosa (strain TUFC12733) TaxID=1330018 RepID=A0A167MYD0_CALVF|nr:hypothetical protein CALVIDRAFT_96317 [Calocera viscosa TUFC12733]